MQDIISEILNIKKTIEYTTLDYTIIICEDMYSILIKINDTDEIQQVRQDICQTWDIIDDWTKNGSIFEIDVRNPIDDIDTNDSRWEGWTDVQFYSLNELDELMTMLNNGGIKR